MDEKQKELTRGFFAHHAERYAQSASHATGHDLKRLLALLEPKASERALDVATGPGHTALALAPFVREVVGIDLTPEMALPFAQAARERGLANVRFQVGDAESLPFPDEDFELVTTRRAAHHFVIQSLTGEDLFRIARYALPFMGVLLLVVALLVAFPEMALWLPRTMTGG